ncbi:hypothetical protein GCM10023085_80740 [Actinomadura viridis]
MARETEFAAFPSWSNACGPAVPKVTAATAAAPAASAASRQSAAASRVLRQRSSNTQAGPPPASAAGSLIAIAAPSRAPAASARSVGARRPSPCAPGSVCGVPPSAVPRGRRPAKTASAATMGAMASVSLWEPATRWKSSSGLQVHIRAVRSRRSGVRDVQYRTAAVSAKASELTSDITKTVSRIDSPPIRDANASCAVASGPYTEGARRHSSTAPTTGSPGRSTARVAYGSCPRTTIRPYAA